MDQPCSFEELRGCLHDIALVNRLTLAYRPTLSWLASLPRTPEPLRIVDVGCGYGDGLRRIAAWAARRGMAVELTGIDLNPNAVRAAQEATPSGVAIRWVHGDAFSYMEPVDVVLSSLLTHHLEEDEIVRFLGWMKATARVGWFVNDLHRMPLPYHAFGVMAAVLPLHRFVRHDGAVSIRRSFRVEDWRRMCAGMAGVRVEESWPARLCVSCVKSSIQVG